jgi:hypothetical protein
MRSNLTIVAMLCAVALVNIPLRAQQGTDPKAGCRRNPQVVDKCRTIHGRVFVANGTPSMRIWIVGTKRILGVLPSEKEIVPDLIKQHVSFETRVYGDFEVCPFTREKAGEMQDVCIESASSLVGERFVEGKDAPVVFRIGK